MNRKFFRRLIVAGWLLTFAYLIVTFVTQESLPPELRSYVEGKTNAPITSVEIVSIVIFVALLPLCVVASIGLYLFKKWARSLSLAMTAVSLLLLPAFGPYVESGWTVALGSLNNILCGAILALAYFSPVREVFEFDDGARESETVKTQTL